MIRVRLNPRIDCDVAVVGAGPAGSAAAIHLARSGLKVFLLDKQFFPRDKVCGDLVGPVALVELQLLGIADLPGYRDSNVIHSAALHLNGRSIISWPMPQFQGLPAHGRVILREKLDHWLFDAAVAAGARGLQGHTMSYFEVQPDCVELTAVSPDEEVHLRTRLLIGADGATSTVARQLRGRLADKHDGVIAIRAYFDGVAGPADQVDMYIDADSLPGYYWLFPTGPNTANVGVGMALDTLPPSTKRLRELLDTMIGRDRALQGRLRGATMHGKPLAWPLPTYRAGEQLVADRVLLVGDAASLVNPLNGEGIQNALVSGRFAAEVAIGSVDTDFSSQVLEAYVARVERELRYDMALTNMVVQLIRNRPLNQIWLQALRIIVDRARSDPDYSARLGGILAGIVPARDALSLGVIRDTFEQAAMSLGSSSLLTALRDPNRLSEALVTLGNAGIELTNETIRRPFGVANWGLKTSLCTIEFAMQAFKGVSGNGLQRERAI